MPGGVEGDGVQAAEGVLGGVPCAQPDPSEPGQGGQAPPARLAQADDGYAPAFQLVRPLGRAAHCFATHSA